ncbi:MAG: cytochrome c oxidase subunit 3 [Betaproteobacteria bacterium]
MAAQTPRRWPPDGPLPLGIASGNTALLLISSVAVIFAERALEKSRRKTFLARQAFAVVLGTVFVAVQLSEWRTKPFSVSQHAFGSLYYVITGFHMAHVTVGLFFLVAVWFWTRRGTYDARQHLGVTVSGYYWHFVDVVWLAVFFSLYIYPRML